jgi:hypothetical protein
MSNDRGNRAFFGWRIVAAVFVLAAFGWGLGVYAPPIYLHAVREARGGRLPSFQPPLRCISSSARWSLSICRSSTRGLA